MWNRGQCSALRFSCCLKRRNGQWRNKVELLFSFFFKRLPFEIWMIRKNTLWYLRLSSRLIDNCREAIPRFLIIMNYTHEWKLFAFLIVVLIENMLCLFLNVLKNRIKGIQKSSKYISTILKEIPLGHPSRYFLRSTALNFEERRRLQSQEKQKNRSNCYDTAWFSGTEIKTNIVKNSEKVS